MNYFRLKMTKLAKVLILCLIGLIGIEAFRPLPSKLTLHTTTNVFTGLSKKVTASPRVLMPTSLLAAAATDAPAPEKSSVPSKSSSIDRYHNPLLLSVLIRGVFFGFAVQPPAAAPSSSKTMKKLFPLGLMLFFILFNYTILRDTKDVLVVTAPNSGAEIIPFLKTYVNLPSAIAFTLVIGSIYALVGRFWLMMKVFLSLL